MTDPGSSILWLAVAVLLAGLVLMARGYFRSEARQRRRRDRSHSPVISRKRGPRVKLAVNLGKPKRNRKR